MTGNGWPGHPGREFEGTFGLRHGVSKLGPIRTAMTYRSRSRSRGVGRGVTRGPALSLVILAG